MAKRNCIGVLYSYDSNWIGGSYYIHNLIMAIKTLPESEKPFLKIICRKPEDFASIQTLQYPYIRIFTLKYSLGKRIVNKVTGLLFGTGWIDRYYLHDIDIIFPANFLSSFRSKLDKFKKIKKVYWIPDFQERYYPEFFDKAEIIKRDNQYKQIAASSDVLVLSSRSGCDDFEKFYSPHQCKVKIVHFAVTHPALNLGDYNRVRDLYSLPDNFYFVPNQFWKHKNHMVVLEAVSELKSIGKLIKVVFSGKESDYRNPEYFPAIKKFVADHKIENQCLFLGFIPREDQLLIMKNSMAVIQPSLFEGWSTVVEDAKALGVFLLASNISTHREQIETVGVFFDPRSADDLVQKINDFESLHRETVPQPKHYSLNVSKFAKDFMDVLNAF